MTQQHAPTEPFKLADDMDPTEPIPLVPPATLGQRLEAFERRVERRFDLLHRDVQQLRADVLPRLAQVEKPSLGRQALTVGKYGVNITAGAVLVRAGARAAAQQWPEAKPVADFLETLLGSLGL